MCDCIQHHALQPHHFKGLQGSLQLLVLLAGVDHGVVSDYIQHHTLQLHLLKESQGLLGLLAFPTGTDQGAVA